MKVYKSVVKPLSPGKMVEQDGKGEIIVINRLEMAKAAYTTESGSSTPQRIGALAAKIGRPALSASTDSASFDFGTNGNHGHSASLLSASSVRFVLRRRC